VRQFRTHVFWLARKHWGSVAGSALIIAIGIFSMVSMFDTLLNLSGQVRSYYSRARLADVFCRVSGIGEDELARLTGLPGIAEASGRLSADLRLIREEPGGGDAKHAGPPPMVTVHLMSAGGTLNLLEFEPGQHQPEDEPGQHQPEDEPGQRLQEDGPGQRLQEDEPGRSASRSFGEAQQPGDGEIFIGARMQKAYGFRKGETIRILSEGRSQRFTFAGTVSAPDYIYTVAPDGAMIPDGRTYDIAVVSDRAMESLLGTGRRSELSFRLSPGTSFRDVRSLLADRLEKYGLQELTERPDQGSVSMVEDEIHELITVGTLLPVIFLSISVFMLYTVLQKMIEQDRGVIGTMKAFGMTDRELLSAYLLEGAAAGIAGAALGCAAAGLLGRYMFAMYVDFFNLPEPVYHDYAVTRALGTALSLVTSCAAVLLGVRRIVTITPAMAMRRIAPESGGTPRFFRRGKRRAGEHRPGEMERYLGRPGGRGHGNLMARLGFRSLFRNPFRGFLIALSVAFPFAMSSVLLSYDGVVDDMIRTEFQEVEDYDLMLSLESEVSPAAARRAGNALPEVLESDAVLVYPCEFLAGSSREYGALHGRSAEGGFWNIRDNSGRFYRPPEHGLILDRRIADKLHVRAGDEIELRSGALFSGRRRVRVEAVIEQMFGGGACLSLERFPELLGVSPAANRVLLRARPGELDPLVERLSGAGRITFLSEVRKTVDAYRDMFDSMSVMMNVFAALSAAAGCILISSILLMNLRERVTELMTLKVLGVSDRELGGMLLLEQTVLFFAGILMGIPGIAWIRGLLESMMKSESYTIRLPVSRTAVAEAFLVCLLMALFSWLRELSVIRRLQLTEALKERAE